MVTSKTKIIKALLLINPRISKEEVVFIGFGCIVFDPKLAISGESVIPKAKELEQLESTLIK